MRALIVASLLVLVLVPALPTAAAEPCEVPGCNVVGAAVCMASHATDVKGWKQWVPDCLTQTA